MRIVIERFVLTYAYTIVMLRISKAGNCIKVLYSNSSGKLIRAQYAHAVVFWGNIVTSAFCQSSNKISSILLRDQFPALLISLTKSQT